MIEPIAVSKGPRAREIRELTPEEVQTVAKIFADHGAVVPDLKASVFVGAVQDGVVLGFIVLQPKLHAEPVWITPGQSQLFVPLVREAERVILQKFGPQYVYLFAPAGRVAQMAATMGMQLEPFVILSKLVMPEFPGKPLIFMTGENLQDDGPIDLDMAVPASEVTQ